MSELKPCPFCGGEAELKHQGNNYTKKRAVYIECKTFGCFGLQRVGVIRNTMEWAEDQVIKKWNTRPDLKAELVEAIISMKEKHLEHIYTDGCELCYTNGINDAIAAINTIMGDTE